MLSKKLFTLSLGALWLSLSLAFSVPAQTSTSSITGTVTDATGAVIPGAKVTAKNEATGVTYTQTTTGAGLYVFPSVPVGSYTVTAEMSGFKTINKTGAVLEVGTPLVVDVTLEVGQASEIVNVEGGYERIQSTNATLGNVVERKAIVDLPLNGRNPLTLITLEPGVTQRSSGAASSGVHINGSRDRAFNTTIDGIDANESSVPNPTGNVYRLTPDNIQEYKVTTNNATAEEGRNSGASVSIATRSGTNEFHGTVLHFLRNDAFNANEWFANASNGPKPALKLNQFGVEVGGPIIKNKTFFFASYQGSRVNFTTPIDQANGIPTVYTPQTLAGNYRFWVPDPNNPLKIGTTEIVRNTPLLVDPRTGELRADLGVRACNGPTAKGCVQTFNFLTGQTVDPVTASLLKPYPAPNRFDLGDGLNTAGFFWNPPSRHNGTHWMWRVDHTINEKSSIYGRYLLADQNTLGGDPLNGRDQVFPNTPPLGEVFRKSHNLAVSYRRTFSSRVINEFTMGFSRFRFLFTQGEANPDFPNIPPYDFNSITEWYLNTPRTERAVTTPQFLDNLSIVSGSHVIRTGFNFRFYQHNDRRGQPGGVNVTPSVTLASASTRLPFAVPTTAANGINSTDRTRLIGIAGNQLGIPAGIRQIFLGDLDSDAFIPFQVGDKVTLWSQGHRLKQYNLYAQDEWKLRNNLTINYGFRWEINPPPTEAAGRVYVANKRLDGSEGPVTFVKADSWFRNSNLGAIGPRLGVAWSPLTKTVIRAGYGLAFDPISSFQVTAVSGKVPGLVFTCSSSFNASNQLVTTPGCQSANNVNLGNGFPKQLAAPNVKPSSFLSPAAQLRGNAPNLTAFDPDLQIPAVHQWNLSVQRELPFGAVLEAAYIGRRGTHLLRSYDLNQINADPILGDFRTMQSNLAKGCNSDGLNCPVGVTGQLISIVNYPTSVPNSPKGPLTQAFVNSDSLTQLNTNAAGAFAESVEGQTLALRLRPNQQFAQIAYIDAGGDSYYHALQVTLRKRFEKGLLFTTAYTVGKSIDVMSVDPVAATSGGAVNTTTVRAPTDIRNWRNEKGRSDFDRRHVFAASSLYELPFGKGRGIGGNWNGLVDAFLGGWNVNSIFNAMSGEPFTVRSGSRTSNNAHESRVALTGATPKAQLTFPSGVVGPVVFPNTDGFALPLPGENGVGRNIFEAPGYWNLDFGVQKVFRLTERFKLQFRSEFFNAFNHPNFDNPRDASTGSPSFQSSLFAQSCCSTVAPPSTQTVIQTGEAARVIQFALKLTF